MKRILITALLVLAAAFVPRREGVFGFPDRASEVTRVLTSTLLWHFWDNLLDCELAHWIRGAEPTAEEPDWRGNSLASLLFQAFPEHAFNGFPSPEHHDCFIASIPPYLIRRTVERAFTSIRERSSK